MGEAVLGLNPLTSYTQAEVNAGRGMGAGDLGTDYLGKKYVFAKASAAVSANRVCLLSDDGTTAQHLTNAQNKIGARLAVATVDVAMGDWGYFQVYGPGLIRVAASTTGGAQLYTTATAGVLGSTSASQDTIGGMSLTTTNGGSEASGLGFINWPLTSAVT